MFGGPNQQNGYQTFQPNLQANTSETSLNGGYYPGSGFPLSGFPVQRRASPSQADVYRQGLGQPSPQFARPLLHQGHALMSQIPQQIPSHQVQQQHHQAQLQQTQHQSQHPAVHHQAQQQAQNHQQYRAPTNEQSLKFTAEDVEILKLLLGAGEKHKWKQITKEINQARYGDNVEINGGMGKNVSPTYVVKQYQNLLGLPKNSVYFGVLGSSLPYVVAQKGWDDLESSFLVNE